jgi:Xaa-Pro aminopeptidase
MTDRIAALTNRLPGDVDAFIVQSPANRFYLTGLRTSAGTLVVTRRQSWFIIDFRYISIARQTVKNAEVVLQENLLAQIATLLKKVDAKKVAVESHHLSVGGFTAMKEAFDKIELTADSRCADALLSMRQIKDAGEIEKMQRVQDISDRVFSEIIGFIRPGRTEREVAFEIYRLGHLYGAQRLSFDTIAVSGINSSLPHGVPSDKPLKRGELLTLDFGYVLDGYCSDMTRTVAVGEIGEKERLIYETTLKAQLAALEAAGPDKLCSDIDKVARDIIYNAGFEGCFGHGLGHSLGLEVHENPRFSPAETVRTQPGMVFSVEPGIYIAGEFGCRIEDVICITPTGCINLTHSPKELIICG